jgi:hypothetical protein
MQSTRELRKMAALAHSSAASDRKMIQKLKTKTSETSYGSKSSLASIDTSLLSPVERAQHTTQILLEEVINYVSFSSPEDEKIIKSPLYPEALRFRQGS